MKVDLEKVRQLNLEPGCVLVLAVSAFTEKQATRIGNFLHCPVLRINDLNTIGVLKFKINERTRIKRDSKS